MPSEDHGHERDLEVMASIPEILIPDTLTPTRSAQRTGRRYRSAPVACRPGPMRPACELARLADTRQDMPTLLALPANGQMESLLEIVDAFRIARPAGCILTMR